MELIALQLFLLSIGASFVQRTTGFGFGIFIMTMLPALMPSYGEATTLSGILAMTTSAIIVVQKYKYINWPRLWPILLMFIIVSFGAIFVLKQMEYGILSILLGITLVIVSIYFAFFSKRIKVKTTMPVQVTAGALSGVMGGFFGMQGPPAVLYFVSSEPDKEHYLAQTQTYFLVGDDDLHKSLQWILYDICSHGLCVWYSRSAYRQSNGGLGIPPYHWKSVEIHYLHVYRHQRPNISVGLMNSIKQ